MLTRFSAWHGAVPSAVASPGPTLTRPCPQEGQPQPPGILLRERDRIWEESCRRFSAKPTTWPSGPHLRTPQMDSEPQAGQGVVAGGFRGHREPFQKGGGWVEERNVSRTRIHHLGMAGRLEGPCAPSPGPAPGRPRDSVALWPRSLARVHGHHPAILWARRPLDARGGAMWLLPREPPASPGGEAGAGRWGLWKQQRRPRPTVLFYVDQAACPL